jgi:exopolyphosphatase/guanosine-5'-triphosphate,3'-diphosphate pyrophosphatase
MRCGCIDIGTNTTRVLVAEAHDGALTEVLQRRAFTRLGRGLSAGGTIPATRIAETAGVVAEQVALARQAGASSIRVVATAVIRTAANRDEFCAAIRRDGGVEVSVLDGEEEARLAFLGATRTLGRPLKGRIAVVDVGGGSSEIAVGTLAGGVEWWHSFNVGSGFLADAHFQHDPPTPDELVAVRDRVAGILARIAPPPVDTAVAVGGSAASLRRLVGEELDPDSLARALGLLTSGRAADVAFRFDLDIQRVRLMPAGLLALDAAARALGRPLQIGRGGLREGVLLDLAGVRSSPGT